MARRFSIRYKFLWVTTLLLVASVGSYLAMATHVFKVDKTELVFDYNRSNVNNIASEVDSLFQSIADKIKLVALFHQDHAQNQKLMIHRLLDQDSDIVYVAISEHFKKPEAVLYTDSQLLKTYGLTSPFFDQLMSVRPVPFEKIKVEGSAVWNATIQSGPPLLGIAKNVVEEDEHGLPMNQFAVIAFVKADKLLQAIERSQLAEVFLTDEAGQILVHSQPQKMWEAGRVHDKIITVAQKQTLKTQVMDYRENGKRILGAFSKAYHNQVLVISRVRGTKAFAAVNRLLIRSLLFGSIVVTLAFIAAILFSRSLTRPLESLMSGMKKVGDGDLQTQIRVRSRDEIAVLAASFNKMISELKDSREKLEEINRDLEKKVKERTLELEKQNLAVKQAQEALLRTTRLAAVGEIAGQAAHEVLNPLTTILSRVQKVRERLDKEVAQESQLLSEIQTSWREDYKQGGFTQLLASWQKPSSLRAQWTMWDEDLDNIEKINQRFFAELQQLQTDTDFLLSEGQRINRIVNSMRSLSVVKGNLQEHSACKLAQRSIHIMADLANQQGVKIELHQSGEVDAVYVDDDEFIQGMTNLLRNALQAISASAQSRTGRIGVEVGNDRDGNVLIRIDDNGCGISPENQKRLFESQFTTKSGSDGTGIGLKISRRFIRSFQGDIYLESSRPGNGSVFIIRLPAAKNAKLVKATA